MTHDDTDFDARFDARLRQVHEASLDHLTPGTRHRLRNARMAPTPARRGFGWALGSAAAAVAVAAIALQLQMQAPSGISSPASVPKIAMTPAAAAAAEPMAMLEESPDLYLWLASADAAPDPMEP